jgi:hypothetical protein
MSRSDIRRLQDIPNIGHAIEKKLLLLGIREPAELIGRDPYKMYDDLCSLTGKGHDPCILDTFISAVRFMEGGPPKKWWEFTRERKERLASK